MYHLLPRDRYEKKARTILAVLFAVFLLLNLLLFFSTPAGLRAELGLALLLNTLWAGVFLGAIWRRQSWARYALAVVLIAAVLLGFLVFIPQLRRVGAPIPAALWAVLAYHFVLVGVPALSTPIRKFVHSR